MCGIVGVLGLPNASEVILEGLKRLEYRGYDSAGIAVLHQDQIRKSRAVGKVKELETKLRHDPLPQDSILGIGHTRWSTHGATTEDNAHPHGNNHVVVVHNGIIENFETLKKDYQAKGYVFATETDTEVIVHILTECLRQGLSPQKAMTELLKMIHGTFALGIIFREAPHMLFCARQGSPLAIGFSDQGLMIGSDALAMGPYIHHITYLEEGDWAVLTLEGVHIYDSHGQTVTREQKPCSLTSAMIGKQNYRHFMLKEIYEQPLATAEALRAYLGSHGEGVANAFDMDWSLYNRVAIIACGTSLYAGHVARYGLEALCGIPVDLEIASEFRYRKPPLSDKTLYIFISQSGETIDTLAARQYVGNQAPTAAIVNVVESSLSRSVKYVWPLHSGPEIGVASTKAFMNQLIVLGCLTLSWAQKTNTLSSEQCTALRHELEHLPALISATLELDQSYQAWAHTLMKAQTVLYLARGNLFPIALEGALKLKELSYIHAEGFAAGEMKHGPIALIDESVPVIVLCPSGDLFEKTLSNIHEVKARGAQLMILTDAEGAKRAQGLGHIITLPSVMTSSCPFLYTIPMQMIAYHTAVLKGSDVDQPRNLAKSVTVE